MVIVHYSQIVMDIWLLSLSGWTYNYTLTSKGELNVIYKYLNLYVQLFLVSVLFDQLAVLKQNNLMAKTQGG